MSVSVYQQHQPTSGAVYAINTVPDLILAADEGVKVQLFFKNPLDTWDPSNKMFEASYTPDFNGHITVNFEELYRKFLETKYPSGNSLFQDDYWFNYNIVWTGISSEASDNVAFSVANAVIKASSPFASWTNANFLTNQPAEKITDMDSKEWLSWFDGTYGTLKLKVRFYPKAGGNEDVIVFTEDDELFADAGGSLAYTVDVSYSRIIKYAQYLVGQLHPYYDIILVDDKGSILARQRYIYQERTGNEKYFLFVNALGGIDTLICQGANTMQPEATFSVGRFGGQYVPVDDADNVRRWQQNLGQLPWKQRNWVHELLTAKQGAKQYDPESGNYYDIVITGMDLGMGDSGQLASGGFTYMRSDAENVIGQEERDTTLHQSVADGSQPFDDLTTVAVLQFDEAQGGSGYETEAVEINATHVYVTIGGTASVYYSINGGTAVEIDPASRMPVVVEIDPGDEIQFSCQSEAPDVVLNYYPTDASQQQAQQNNEL